VGKLLRVGVFSEQMLNRDGKAKHLSSPIIYLQYLYILKDIQLGLNTCEGPDQKIRLGLKNDYHQRDAWTRRIGCG
jgi:hypothetical protein